MIPPFRLYLFDVDGTLLDSAPDICGAIRQSLAGTPHAQCDEAFLRSYIGRHLFELFQNFYPGKTVEELEEMRLRYRAIYLAREHRSTRIFPGVPEALAALKGDKSTATTKGTPTTLDVLKRFGLLPHFQHVQGTDGFPAKPEPDVVYRSLEVFQTPPEQCLMVGDSAADIEAGRRAGVRTCAVRYGYGDSRALEAQKPDFWVDDLRELAG